MMKFFKFLIVGTVFGIILTKAEVISWYRIQEMFLFDSFHMYGIIGSAVIIGMIIVKVVKKFKLKSIEGTPIVIKPKDQRLVKAIIGGTCFGIGWAMVGACPGPVYVLIGNGFSVFIVVLISALVGKFTYGLLKNRLPH